MLRVRRSRHQLAFAGALVGVLAFGSAIRSASAADDAPAADTGPKPKSKPGKSSGKSHKTAKKRAAPKTDSGEKPELARRRRIGVPPAYVVGDSNAHLINEAAPPIEQFPSEAGAVKKAFAETRRDQLVDAEKAARDEKSPDRWRTVLFMLRGLPERTDSEACFWRVLAFYRLGEIPRARALRENCDLPSKDSGVLNSEDVTASGIPEMGTVAVDDGFGPTPAATNAKTAAPQAAVDRKSEPYKGPSPQKK